VQRDTPHTIRPIIVLWQRQGRGSRVALPIDRFADKSAVACGTAADRIKFTLNSNDLNLYPQRPLKSMPMGHANMLWNIEKLEQERIDLIEVIAALRHLERVATEDRSSIFEKITAHMVRLSELDAEQQRIHSVLEVG
jgi:hypothetical protein